MISAALKADVCQVRLNELCGKHVHQVGIRWPRRGTQLVDVLTFVVPILYFAPKVIWTDPTSAPVINAIDVVLSVLLLGAAALRKTLGWDETVQARRNCISQNLRTANQALELLQDDNALDEAAKWFLRRAKEPNPEESRLLEEVDDALRQKSYRAALKEFEPAAKVAPCLVCNASAWHFTPGSCQVCGGTPVGTPEKTTQ